MCNIAGVTVAVVAERALPAGTGVLLWDGRSRSGTLVPGGAVPGAGDDTGSRRDERHVPGAVAAVRRTATSSGG